MLGHTRTLSFSSARYWSFLLCASCAQLAGFEDFHGATGAGGEGGSEIATGGFGASPTGSGGAANGGAREAGGNPSGGDPSGGAMAGGGGKASGGGGKASGGGGKASGGTANGGSETGGATAGGEAGDPCGQLLVNPAFANGSHGWTETSSYPDFANNLHPIIVASDEPELAAEGVSAHSDEHLLWLGGVPNANREHVVMVSRVVTLSPKLEELQFSAFAWIATDELEEGTFDNLYVELRAMDADESLVWQFIDRDNRDATSGWVELEPSLPYPSDIEQMRGQTVTFMAYSRTDSDNVTHFWLDSMSLRGLCSP